MSDFARASNWPGADGTTTARRHRRGAEIVLFGVLLLCFVYFFPRWADWNQNSRFDLVLALVEDRTVRIDRYVANTGDYAYYAGHYYSDKAPGMSLLGVPVYAAFRALVPADALSGFERLVGRSEALRTTLRPEGAGASGERLYFFLALTAVTFVVVAIPSALLGLLLFRAGRSLGLGVRPALAMAALYALGTNAFPYANAFVGHQTSAFLLFAAFVILFAIRRGALPRPALVAAGFLLGLAAITEYPAALIGALLGVYALLTLEGRPGTIVRLVAGGIPPLLALALYDYAAFGTPVPVGYLHSALWADVHHTGFVSLTGPQPDALWGITFGAYRGLFFLSPFLLVAVPGYLALWRQRRYRAEFWPLLLAPLAFLLFNGSSVMWQGGFSIGPRYFLPALPFLALAAGFGLAAVWRWPVARPALILACVWSIFAVWTESIAGQSFPDYTPNPLFDLSLPTLLAGDVARNAGMVLGLRGPASLIPLAVAIASAILLVTIGGRPARRPGTDTSADQRASAQVVAP